MPYGSICCTYHQLKYSSPNRSKTKTRATLKSLPFGKRRFREKEVRSKENGPKKAEKDKTEKATGLSKERRHRKVGLN